MRTIRDVILDTLSEENTPKMIAETLGVTEALVSTWKNKENDFCPRLRLAAKVYKYYGEVVFPYSEEALKFTNDTL